MTVHIPVDMHRFFLVVIDYSYDSLSRLLEADYNNGASVYNYGYDVAGNLVDYDGVTRTYNATNQMTNDGTNTLTYDNNGNLRTVGSDTYTWDRANRLLNVGNHSYVYDGMGNRVQQTVSSVVTDYLNDLQPGLTKLLKQDDGTNVEHFVHGVRGIHAVDDGTDWNFYAQDGLGSVRAVVDDMAVVQSSLGYDPYGTPTGTTPADFGFTGEMRDGNGMVYLRARYYEPGKAVFNALDPFEGLQNRPMSLNGYSWVEGNVIKNTDPSGQIVEEDGVVGYGWPDDVNAYWYSCNCGWIDTNHMSGNRKALQKLMNSMIRVYDRDTDYHVFWGSDPDTWLFDVNKGAGPGNIIAATRGTAVIPDNVLRNHEGSSREDWIFRLASSILMELTERFERNQGRGIHGIYGFFGPNSSWSEEDLISNLIGFYQAKVAGPYTLYRGSQWAQIEEDVVVRMCGVFHTDDAARRTFEIHSGNGTNRSWLDPSFADFQSCPELTENDEIAECVQSGGGNLPGEIASIVHNKIDSNPSGSWWWFSDSPPIWGVSGEGN